MQIAAKLKLVDGWEDFNLITKLFQLSWMDFLLLHGANWSENTLKNSFSVLSFFIKFVEFKKEINPDKLLKTISSMVSL